MITEYVLNTIKVADTTRSIGKHQILSVFKSAETSECSQQDIDELKIIGGALSMSYSNSEEKYCPMFIMNNGDRSFSMDDVDEYAIAILSRTLEIVNSSWICAQLADILWIKTADYKYGQIAVKKYINLFYEIFDEVHWVECFAAISRANFISIKLGKSSPAFQEFYKVAIQEIYRLNGTDPLFLSLKLIRMIYTSSSNEELNDFLGITNKIVEKSVLKDNVNLVEDAFSVLEILLKKLKKSEEILLAKKMLATYYKKIANQQKSSGVNGVYIAIDNLQKAYNIYTKCKDQEGIFQIRKDIEELQHISIGNMPSIPFEFDATKIYTSVRKLFKGLSLQEMIVQLGRTAMIYQEEDVKNQVLQEQKKYIFKSMFGSCIVDKNGHTIEYLPALSLDSTEADEKTLFKHMVKQVTEIRLFGEAITLQYALQMLNCKSPFTVDQLNFLIDDNPIIPEGRTDIIKTGLYMGLSGDLYAAMHILLPQTEHIFRNLVDMCEDTITYLKEDGTEDYKPLSQLFNSYKLQECYDENIIFSFRSIMDEKAGSNLRNLVAHGLLDSDVGNSGVALCFLCLLIRLLSLYSKPAREITAQLIVLDSKRGNTSE